MEFLLRERFDLIGLKFPIACVRCGVPSPNRQVQLILPYRAWWRSNPVVKAPACTNCYVLLKFQEWITLVLMYGVSIACAFCLPQWSIRLIIQVRGKAFNPETLGRFAEAIVSVVLLGAIFLFGHYRVQFLRRDHLKVKIANYGDDWLEIVSNDRWYFGELVRDSTIFS